jgi:hypothetical protein
LILIPDFSYAIAFLSVMSLFALGNLMLKFKRSQLKREVRATWLQTFIALGGVIIALLGKDTLLPKFISKPFLNLNL